MAGKQDSYFGKSELVWKSETVSTQNELNQCGVTDLVMDLASTRDDGKRAAGRRNGGIGAAPPSKACMLY